MEHNNSEKKKRKVLKVLKYIGFGILGVIGVSALALIFGYFVMRLWNYLMTEIFGLGTITYFQAFGLIILAASCSKLPSAKQKLGGISRSGNHKHGG